VQVKKQEGRLLKRKRVEVATNIYLRKMLEKNKKEVCEF